jgi:hypothetical protein
VFIRKRKNRNNSSSTRKIQTPNVVPESLATSSTQNKKGSPDSPAKTGETGESGVLINNLPNEKPLTQTTIEGEDGRKVVVSVYSAGEVETVEDGKVIRRTKLKFVLKYKDVVKECVSASNDLNVDCGLTVKEVAKATHYSISYRELWEAINELRGKFVKEEAVSLVDYVRQKYPKEWEELKRDPIGWFLRQSERWHLGDDEVKLLTLIAVKSAFYEGLPKVGVLVLGSSGAGKSSAVKSILNMFTLKEGRSVVLWVSNLTKKALGNLAFTDGGKLLKNRCLFIIEAIDVETLKELSMLMTEGKLANLTAKVGEDVGGFYGTVEYPPSVVSTAVNIDYNNDQVTQIMSRFLTIAVDLESRDTEKIYEKIAERDDLVFEYDPVVKYLAIAWLHYTPKRVTLPKEVAVRFKEVITEYNQYAFRVYEQGLKVMKIFASLLGKEVVDEEVYELFVRKLMRYFIVSAVGLTSVELKALQATTDEFELTKNIADRLRVDVETAKAWLYNLARKGLVDHEREGNRNKWKRNAFGQKMLELVIDGYKPDNDTNEAKAGRGAQEVDPQFIDFVKGNAGMTHSFDEIYASFLDIEKTRQFVDWCVRNGYCEVVTEGNVKKYRVIDRIGKAYEHLKRAGRLLAKEFQDWYGDDVIEALIREGKIVFEEVGGELYVKTR